MVTRSRGVKPAGAGSLSRSRIVGCSPARAVAGALLVLGCGVASLTAGAALPSGEASAPVTEGRDRGSSAQPAGSGLPDIPRTGELRLTPRLMLQLTLARNADAMYSRLNTEISGHMARAEQGLFEVVAYGGLRHEDRERERTAQEIASNIAASNEVLLNERVDTAEMGVRRRLGLGGEISLSYRITGRSSNLILKVRPSDTEYDGALALTFKQPLLRGFGSAAVDSDRKIAELDWAISKQQYKQQILRTSSEALSAYWQLQRAYEAVRLRQLGKRQAQAALADMEARIAAGRLAPSAVHEARSLVATRSAEIFRAEQTVSEAETKVKTLLNLSGKDYAGLHLVPVVATQDAPVPGDKRRPDQALSADEARHQRLEQALRQWPGYRIAELKQQQGKVRLDFARNLKKPMLDLTASCSSTRLTTDLSYTAEKTFISNYPDCYIGLNVEMPIEGNLRATSQHYAQQLRMTQSEVELEAVRTTLANDMALRELQIERIRDEVAAYRQDVDARSRLLDIEQRQFRLGLSRLSQVIARENELNESQDRLLDSQSRLELARIALRVADGTLLSDHAVEWRGD